MSKTVFSKLLLFLVRETAWQAEIKMKSQRRQVYVVLHREGEQHRNVSAVDDWNINTWWL